MRRASPSAIAVLPTPGSPINTGLFFVRRESTCMTRRISWSRPITGSSFPCARPLHQIDAVAFQGLELPFRRLIGHPRAAADGLQHLQQLFVGDGVEFQDVFRLGIDFREGQQQMFGRDELVFHRVGFALGGFEHQVEFPAALRRRSARDVGEMAQFGLDDFIELRPIDADLVEDRPDDAVVFLK